MQIENPLIVLPRESQILVDFDGELKLVTLQDEVSFQMTEPIDIENPEIHKAMLDRATAAVKKLKPKKKDFDDSFLQSLKKQFDDKGALSVKQKSALEKVHKKLEIMCKNKDIDIKKLV